MATKRSYYRGGVRVMLGNIPCKLARQPSETTMEEMRKAARRFIPRDRTRVTAQDIAREQEAFAALPKLGNRSLAEIGL